MLIPQHDSTLARVQPFFQALLTRDPSGRSWLSSLLRATPHGPAQLGDLIDSPGSISIPLSVPTVTGRLACFQYPASPPQELLMWYVENPERLTWPPDQAMSPETTKLRNALIRDDPPGAQARAQERARELVLTRASRLREWWRFEDVTTLDCVLITERLALTVVGKRTEGLSIATDWYPARSQLVQNLEAARSIAEDRRWASVLVSDRPLLEGSDEHLERTLADAAPHLDQVRRDALHRAYLGNITWAEACGAVGMSPADLRSHS